MSDCDAVSIHRNIRPWRPDRCDQIALVLQGGGALGAYQGGVFEALHEAGVEPDWVSGVSIGAINAAIIAGNPPELRLARLQAFWERVTDRKIWLHTPDGDIFRRVRNTYSALVTHWLGQPGFFSPRSINPWLAHAGAKDALSYYDTAPLRETLLELVDFDLINKRKTRFSVGAVNVRTGNFLYFDNHDMLIGPEHVMASGALPPAFPMVQIGTDYFWDGGIVSNTPLQHVLEYEHQLNTLIFQVDLFSSRGALPRDIQDVMSRQKDITYASRTRYNTDVYRLLRKWKRRTLEALLKIPHERRSNDDQLMIDRLTNMPEIVILHLIYQQQAYEGSSKDHEFSGTSMREHWRAGLSDTRRTLSRRDWLEMPPEGVGVVIHDVHREHELME
jgi:NTE family protein